MTKPVIKIWCLPRRIEEDYVRIHSAVVGAIVTCNIGVKDQDDMIFLPQQTSWEKGLGKEIVVVEFDLTDYHNECNEVLDKVLDVIKSLYPQAYVQGRLCYIAAYYECRP